MSAGAKGDFSVILLDINSKFKQYAIQILMKIYCTKYLNASKEPTKLILFNSKSTGNCLSDRYGSYENILEFSNVTTYNPNKIYDFVEKTESYDEDNNWIEALSVGLENLKQESEDISRIATKQLVLISDLKLPVSSSQIAVNKTNLIEEIIRDLNEHEIFLYIIGPNIDIPITLNNIDDISKWQRTIELPSFNENFHLARKIIESTENTIICNSKIGTQILFVYKNSCGKQPWKEPLSFGSKIQLPTQTLKLTDNTIEMQLITDKKESSQFIWVCEDKPDVQVDPKAVINGILRHGKFVPCTDENMFRCNSLKGFNIIGFTKTNTVPEYLMMGEDCYYVLPDGDNPEENLAFNTLIDCLDEQDKYVIARRVYRNNLIPKFVVLIPKPNHKPKCFFLTELPYSDDIVVDYKTDIISKTEKKEKIKDNTIYQYLSSLEIDNRLPLGICLAGDVNDEKVINVVADKLRGKHLNLDELDSNFFDINVSEEVLDNLQKIWPERELPFEDEQIDEYEDDEIEY